jgi:predicted nucleic acid-binding protein
MPTQKTKKQQRWLLDTNVWSSIADANLGPDLANAARRKRIEILAVPSVLYELIRTPNETVRRRFVDVITMENWKRVMPETYFETSEILGEIRRLRPEWLRARPDRSKYMRIYHDWRSKNGAWRRARDTPSSEAKYDDELGAQRFRLHVMNPKESAKRLTRRV